MPRYDYICPECGLEVSHSTSIARRDNVACNKCSLFHGEEILMRRQPSAPNFKVAGFNAKNGYSKAGK